MVGKLDFEHSTTVSFFETVIRILGGLAAAHDLSGDAQLGEKAKDLADRLLPAFDSAPTGAGAAAAAAARLAPTVHAGASRAAAPGLLPRLPLLLSQTPAPLRPPPLLPPRHHRQHGEPAARAARRRRRPHAAG